MFSEDVQPVAAAIEPAMVIENGAGKHVPRYRVEVDMSNMTWGDSMIQVKFQLLMETADEIEGDDPKLKAQPDDTTEESDRKAKARRVKRNQRIHALKELRDGFNEMTAYLDRVATVYCDGVIMPSVAGVPMHAIKDIMTAIGAERDNQGNPKN